MSLGVQDFEFYTFFLGLKQPELESLKQLLGTFPYYDLHKINIIDQSRAVKRYQESGAEKFYCEWRSFFVKPARDIDESQCELLLREYAPIVNRIIESDRLFHGQAIDKVMKTYAKARYVIIMDADISWVSRQYLSDVMTLCERYSEDELAAIGTLTQERPFHLTLNPEVPVAFYSYFNRLYHRRIPWGRVLRAVAKGVLRRSAEKRNELGRFQRLHPALLVINRKIFNEHNMTFRNLYLQVLDVSEGVETNHRILGDNGASFLYECAMAGKQIVNIDLSKYVTHKGRVSTPGKREKGWNWFNADLADEPRDW